MTDFFRTLRLWLDLAGRKFDGHRLGPVEAWWHARYFVLELECVEQALEGLTDKEWDALLDNK